MVAAITNIPSYDVPATGPTVWGDPSQMFALSLQLIGITENYIAQLASQASNLTAPVINPSFPVLAAAPVPAVAQEPSLIDVNWLVPTQPAPFTGVLSFTATPPGPFTGVAPTLVFPTAPQPFLGLVPPSPAVDLNFVYPTVSVSLPTVPSLLSLDTVQFDVGVIPTFDVNVPILTINSPNIIPYNEPAGYTSMLLTTLEASLIDAMQNGTWTGLPPNIETNLFDRAREREYRANADALIELDRMETLGYAFPPGAFIDARIKAQTELAYTLAGLSREIMVKQAELILENTVKARENATALNGQLITYYNAVAQRTFEASKYYTEAAIAIYNGQVETYKAQLEGYKTEALVYDTQIKGILAQVDIIKAHIEFEQVKSTINTALVEQYKAEVQAALAIVEVYKVQLEIIQTQASVEKTKVEIFGEQIKAFVGQVNAYTAQVEGYKAVAETQGVIENVFKTQVEAYTAQVNAFSAEANVEIAELKVAVDVYTAQIEGYKAAVAGMVGQAQAASLFNTAEADVYKAATAAISSYNGTLTAQWEAVINEQEKIAEIAVQAAKANGDLYIAARGLSLDATKVGAQVAGQLGSAAIGAIHWANNSSWALSTSAQISNSTITSTATNHNFNETA